MSDELTTVDSSATDDVSDRNEMGGTILSNDIMSLDQTCRASVSITSEAAEIAS